MKKRTLRVAGLAAALCSLAAWAQDTPQTVSPLQPVPFKDVSLTDAFWTPRLENNRKVTIPALLARYGEDPDLRLLEAACYTLVQHPDRALRNEIDRRLDRLIERIRSRKHRWSNEGDGELLWAGNFLEASVAYFEATGSRKLLDVATEIADDLDAVFGPQGRHDISNHEGIKLGLLRLFRCTGQPRYLKLAQFFLDARGNPTGRSLLYGPYAQDHQPVTAQSRAIGHAVRATYLYIPLTDLAALTGNAAYLRADQRLWLDAVSKRTFLTGGFGTYRDEEDFGDDYDLPNLSCWNEICAAYGNAWWNHKLFLLTRDAKYADMMERVLYNALLAGVSLKGDTFLYQAPLKTYGSFGRHEWFGPNCCPPNVARLLPQLGSLVFAHNARELYVNLFLGAKAELKLGDTPLRLTQETRYPWDGTVQLTLQPQGPKHFALLVRIPGWARNEPWPGDLYRQLAAPPEKFTLQVNGRPAKFTLDKGYARLERQWQAGDRVLLTLPLPVRRIVANDRVADDRGLVAFERGPLVFCAEQADNPNGVFNLLVEDQVPLQFQFRPELLGGIGQLTGQAVALGRGTDGLAIVKQAREFVAVPYYAFANRRPGEMAVWLAREPSRAKLPPQPTIASTSRASSSCGNGTVADNYPGHQPPTFQHRLYPNSQDGSGDLNAICDQIEPVNSEDGSSTFLRLHPQSGNQAWVQYDFARPAKVSSVEVYWKDDKQFCVLPQGWRLLYREGAEWKPVKTSRPCTVAKDQFNRLAFAPVTTSALRLEIELQARRYKPGSLGPPDGNYLAQELTWYECGLIEWRVNP